MNNHDVRDLTRVRDEFALRYERAKGDFVSLGFRVEENRPFLRVIGRSAQAGSRLPTEFEGIPVRFSVGEPEQLAVGPAI